MVVELACIHLYGTAPLPLHTPRLKSEEGGRGVSSRPLHWIKGRKSLKEGQCDATAAGSWRTRRHQDWISGLSTTQRTHAAVRTALYVPVCMYVCTAVPGRFCTACTCKCLQRCSSLHSGTARPNSVWAWVGPYSVPRAAACTM